jgi:hypothetical protein
MPPEQAWTGCIAGALTRAEFEGVLADAGLVDVQLNQPASSSSASALT